MCKGSETGPTVYRPCPRRLQPRPQGALFWLWRWREKRPGDEVEKTTKSDRMQLSLQSQHFLLSYLKTLLTAGPAGL